MATLTENLNRPGSHILSEGDPQRTRSSLVVASGNHKAGTVMAKDGSGKLVQLAPAAGNSTAEAVGVLYAPVDASGGEAPGNINDQDTVVQDSMITWPAGITAPQKEKAVGELKALGIKVR